MNKFMTVAAIATLAALAAAPAAAKKEKRSAGAQPGELVLHQMTDYNGDYYTIDSERTTVRTEWNIRSISMHEGEKWEICARPRFRECIQLGQSVPDATMIGVTGQIGSARKVTGN